MQSPYADLLTSTLQSPTFLRATLSGPHRLQKSPVEKITIRPLLLQNTPHLQISSFTDRQDHTQNILPENLPAALPDLLAPGFANLHLTTTTEEIDARLTKKLKLTISRKPHSPDSAFPIPHSEFTPHNRTKILPLPENTPNHLLQVMGIMTPDGKIRPTMQSKFSQINEFLKLLDPLLDQFCPPNANLLAQHACMPAPLFILDAGSGSAYLTLALHHYLTHIKAIPAQILGIDVNDSLIQKSIERANQIGNRKSEIGNSLNFQNSPIAKAASHRPDIVLALHACDTATDDAIALAINAKSTILLAAPCCHKNLNHITIPQLAPLHRHGILHQRLADLLTDTFRALILRIMGYKTDVIEFISQEHTARNLMIRAIRTTTPGNPQFQQEYQTLKTLTAATPHLEKILSPEYQIHLAP